MRASFPFVAIVIAFLMLAFTGCGKATSQVPASGPPDSITNQTGGGQSAIKRQQWDNKVLFFRTTKNFTEALMEQGNDGWELVSAQMVYDPVTTSSDFIVAMKRPRQ